MRGWFQEILYFRNFTLSEYTIAPGTGRPAIVAALPVYDSAGQLRGVLGTSIRLYWLTSFLREASLPTGGSVFLLDKEGNVLAGPGTFFGNFDPADHSASNASIFATIIPNDLAKEVVERRLIDFQAVGGDGVRRVISSVALPHGDVVVVFALPAARTLGWIERDLLTRILSLAAIWLTAIAAALIGTHYLVIVWVSALRRMARAYAGGDFTARTDMNRAPAELKDLGDGFVRINRLEPDKGVP
jgi:hypothetical protein